MSFLMTTDCTEITGKCEHKNLAAKMHLLNNMRKEGSLCDVVLVVQGQHFSAHRAVLAAESKFFSLMFTTAMSESVSREVEMRGVDPTTIDLLLEYIYTARISINSDNVLSLLNASNQYQVEPVKEMCERFLIGKLDAENCLGLFAMADYFVCQELKEVAEDFVLLHFADVYKQNTFLQLHFTQIVSVLHQDKLFLQSETQIYDAAMRWIKYDICNRQKYMAEVLRCVRFPFVPKTFLSTVVLSDPLIKDNLQYLPIVSNAVQDHVGPDHHPNSAQNNQNLRQGSFIAVIEANHSQPKCSLLNPKSCIWEYVGVKVHSKDLFMAFFSDNALFIFGGKRFIILDCQMRSTSHIKSDSLAACGSKEMIYTSGGTVGKISVTSFERYDTKTKSWQKLPKMLTARSNHSSVAANGLIYVCGGTTWNNCFKSRMLNKCEVYDPSMQRWREICSMNRARSNHGLVVVKNRIYALGGQGTKGALNSVEYYDIGSNKWHRVSSMPWKGVGLKCAAVGSIIYVLAGQIFQKDSWFQYVLVYHTHSDRWFISGTKAFQSSDCALGLVKCQVTD